MRNSSFCRLAVNGGQLTRDQQRELEHAQQSDPRPVGDLAVSLSMLTAAQCQQLRGALQQELAADGQWLPAALRESELGRLAVYRGLLTLDELKTALWQQQLLVAEGLEEKLGQLMVRSGFLTKHQLLHSLLYEVLFCERCQTLFKVNGFELGMRIKCTSCPVMLKPLPHDMRLVSSSRDLFIDSHGVEERTWYSELAIRHQFCTPEQIKEATDRWARGLGDKSIGEILIGLGHINEAQDEEIHKHVERQRQLKVEKQRIEYQGMRFGEISVKMRLTTSQMLLEALQRKSERGTPVGEALVQLGYLTRNQGLRVLEMQNKAIVRCDPCAKQYNISLRERGLFPSCPDCKQRMTRVQIVETLLFDRELAPVRAEG